MLKQKVVCSNIRGKTSSSSILFFSHWRFWGTTQAKHCNSVPNGRNTILMSKLYFFYYTSIQSCPSSAEALYLLLCFYSFAFQFLPRWSLALHFNLISQPRASYIRASLSFTFLSASCSMFLSKESFETQASCNQLRSLLSFCWLSVKMNIWK